MKKRILKLATMGFLLSNMLFGLPVQAADRNLIDFDEAYNKLFSPDFDGNVLSQEEADAIIESIIADIDANYMHYTKSNRQAFYNAVEQKIPGNRALAVHKTMPEYFIAYVDALNEEAGNTSEPELVEDGNDYSVDASLFDTIVDFHLLRPTYRHIQIDTTNQEFNFQGRVLDDSSNYDYYVQEVPNRKIKVLSSDGSGVREVIVSTNVVVTGLNANYHYGTEEAYLFHNSQGSVSLAYPDLTGLIQDADEQIWLEYRLVGNYGSGFKLIDHNEIAAGRPEFDPTREWWDQLARADAEYTLAHIASPQNVNLSRYNFEMNPIFSNWYHKLYDTEPILQDALHVYDETFAYELLNGPYSSEEAEVVTMLRLCAFDFIRRAEDERRYEQKIRSTKVALSDRLHNYEKLKSDPVLEEIFNQIAVYTGMTLQGHDLLFAEQYGNEIEIGIRYSEAGGSGYPIFIYDLLTGELYNDVMGGDVELISEDIFKRKYGVETGPYKPKVNIPADYQLNQELVDELVGPDTKF